MEKLIALLMLFSIPVYADVTSTATVIPPVPVSRPVLTLLGGYLDVPGNSDIISSYSFPLAKLEAGYGYGILRVDKWATLDLVIMGTQSSPYAGLSVSVPTSKIFGTGILTALYPNLDKIEIGLNCAWGYDLSTDSNGNTFFKWKSLPDYGISTILRF